MRQTVHLVGTEGGALVAAIVWFVLKADIVSVGSDLKSRDMTEKYVCVQICTVCKDMIM